MFQHRLALALGLPDVDLLLYLPERKLDAWRAFDRAEPIGPRESRNQLAELLAMLANRWRRQGVGAIDREDFLLQTVEDSQQRGVQKMIAQLSSLAVTKPAGYHRKRPGKNRGKK